MTVITALRGRSIVSLISIITAVVSSLILLIIDSWIKYPLIVIEIATILYISAVIMGWDFRVSNPLTRSRIPFFSVGPELMLLSFSSLLIFFNYSQSEYSIVFQLIMSIASSSILVGLCIFNVFKLSLAFTNLERLVISFAISVVFSALLSLIVLPLDLGSKPITISFIFIAIAISSLVVRKIRGINNQKGSHDIRSFSRNADIVGILLCEVFCIFIFFSIYPGAAHVVGTDISRHYGNTLVLITTPDLYNGFQYIFFNLFQGTILSLSDMNKDFGLLQISLVFLNTFFPLAVYAMARRYLSKFDIRIPILATILYLLFSNLSFLYYFELKISGPYPTELAVIQAASEKTFNGAMNFIQPIAFFTPQSVSVLFFVIAIMMLTMLSLSRTKFIPILILLIVGMYLTHVSEAIIFIIIVSVSSFIFSEKQLRLSDALSSSLISIVLIGGFMTFEQYGWRSEISSTKFNSFSSLAIVSTLLLVIGTIFWKSYLSRKLVIKKEKINLLFRLISSKPNFYRIMISTLLVIYIVGLFTWQYAESFKVSSVVASGIAPWFIYPMLLGIVGLLAIVSIRFLYASSENCNNILKARNSLTIILFFIVILFVFGRIVTFVNTNYTHTGYWEKRFLGYIFLMAALVAPVPLIGFYETIRKKFNESVSRIFTVLFISIIMILGFSSFAIHIEFWNLFGSVGSSSMSQDELSAVSFLRNKIADEKDSFVITPTKQSGGVVVLAGLKYPFTYYDLLSSSKGPMVPMHVIDIYNSNHTYLFLHDRDYNLLAKNPDNWLFSHLLPMLRPIYSNDEVLIYEIPPMSYPQLSSDSILLTPNNERDKRWLYAYDMLAFTGGNYTVRTVNGEDSYREKTKILSYDPNAILNLNESFSSDIPTSLAGYRQLSGNWSLQKDGLHAGFDANLLSTQNMILTPIRHSQGDNLNISTSVLINEVDPTIPNYIRLIYSWQNPTNYRFVETLFTRHVLYLNSGTVNDGKVLPTSEWPGIRTISNWTQGDVLDFSMSLSNNTLNMNLNGTNLVYNKIEESESGYVGFYSFRGKDIIFKDFSVIASPTENNISQFIEYVKNGGSLTVINTDGRGSLYDFVKDRGVNEGKGDNESTDSKSTSELFSAKVGKGEIRYIDVFQTINNIENGHLDAMSLYGVSKYLDVDRFLRNEPNFGRVKAIFDDVSANGTISATAQSLILPSKIEDITFKFENGSRIFMNNVSDVIVRHHDRVKINTDQMMIKEGTGVYSSMISSPDEPTRISFNGTANVSLNVKHSNLKLQNVSIISVITKEPISLLDSSFMIDGNTTFKKVLSGQLRGETGVEGQDLMVEGKSSFDVLMADSNILAEKISVEGKKEVNPPVVGFDEFRPIDSPLTVSTIYSVPQVVRGLLALPVIIAILLIVIPLPRDRSFWKPEHMF